VYVTVNGDFACNRTALPENGTEPADPDGDMSVKAIGLLLYVAIFITPNDVGIAVLFPGLKACQISTFAPLLAE
jgi:hypothetical protein